MRTLEPRLLLTLAHGAGGRSQSQRQEERAGRGQARPAAHQGPHQPSGRAGAGAQVMSQSRVVVAVVTRLQRRPPERREESRQHSRPLWARAGLGPCGPHSLTPTTLFVTLQRISCNIFLPTEIKQSGSNQRLSFRMRKITS